LGPAFRAAHPAVLGLDGAFSLPLRNGRSLWVFGDTLLGRWLPGGRRQIEGMPPNTAAYVDDADWVTGFAKATFAGTPHPAPVLTVANRPAGRRVWPLDLAPAGGRSWLWFVEIEPFGKGPLDFKVTDAQGVLFGADTPLYGSSAMAAGGHVYLYAGGVPTKLARVPAAWPDDPKQHEFWTGGGWSRDAAQAAALPDSGPEVSVRPNRYLGGYLMVYVAPFGKQVLMRTAPAPEGPWSAPRTLAACQPAGDDQAMFYGAKQHAELAQDGGREVVISYNTNAGEAALADRPDLYWPRLLRVRFRTSPAAAS
jgi:hypothetical protein